MSVDSLELATGLLRFPSGCVNISLALRVSCAALIGACQGFSRTGGLSGNLGYEI